MRSITPLVVWALGAMFVSSHATADLAVLIDEGVLVNTSPTTPPEALPGAPVTEEPRQNANYVSSGAWAVTSQNYVDKATMVFDFGGQTSVTAATLKLPIEQVYAQNGFAPIKLEFFSDNGVIEYTDYATGFPAPIGRVDAAGLTEVQFDVTGAVNAALNTGRFIGFRVLSALNPGAVAATVPAFTGVKFLPGRALLEFVPGPPPNTDPTVSAFDGYTLEVPSIDIPSMGNVYARFRLVDPNRQIFQLIFANVNSEGAASPLVSGLQLFDCNAFAPPDSTTVTAAASASYSVNSGVLDIPNSSFQNEQFSVRMEFIEGSNPLLFDLLTFESISTDTGDAVVSDITGSLLLEPTQDFVPACHGWVVIGDSIRNRFVERNVITGETGKIYPFNTIPDQMSLDLPNGLIFFTVHPEAARLYKLDLNTGKVSYNIVKQTLSGLIDHTYSWALRDIAIGESGNVFALMIDRVNENPENEVPYTETGKWLGFMDANANFLTDSLPLLEPVRVEYDPVQDHVFMTTTSNLVTFNYNADDNSIEFVKGTDVAVGDSCTDFSISPDGNRLAYSCPDGNDSENPEFSIWDIDPLNYFNNDGEWYLEDSPISATFNNAGTILVATDNSKLYFFDVVTHLLLEDYELGLLEGESVKRVRFSKDGNLVIIALENDPHIKASKFLYMNTPPINGTPL